MTPHVGRRTPRVNDHKALRGTGRYLDDIVVPGLREAAVLRSPVAHGVITSVTASTLPAGADFVGPAAIEQRCHGQLPVLWVIGDQDQRHTPVVDAHLRYVGQPIGVVVASNRYEAEDGIDDIDLGIDDLPPVATMEAALAPGAPLLYPDRRSNVLATFEAGDTVAHTDEVFARADQVLSTTIRIGRVHGLPMETRGVLVVPEPDGRLTVYTSTQAPHAVRDVICEVLELRRSAVRVVAPDVGGGFGLKDHLYEDEMMVIVAALELGCPVKWVEDRFESLVATTHARDELHEIDVAFDRDGILRGLRVEGCRNAGGRFAVFGGGPLFTAYGNLPGPYRWDAVRGVGRLVATTTMSTGAYRGFGQTQAAMIRERAVDLVAAELGIDPVHLRIRNMLGPDELPYTTRTHLTFDNGDYPAALTRAAEMVAESPTPDDGRRRGVGFCSYVQMAGIGNSDANELIGLAIGGYETAVVRMEPDGSVRVATGVSPHGQGLETSIPQLVADQLGVDPSSIELVHGDTDTTPYSAYGTAASRSMAVGGGSALVASRRVADQIAAVAAEMLEANPADIELVDGRARVVGTEVSVGIVDVARRAWQGFRLPEGMEPGLQATYAYDPPSATFSYATHACRVAIDESTGQVEVEDYVVVNDCGTIVNPMIVEGQIHGGVAQGIGAALIEAVGYDADGQPQSSTLLDYQVPVSATVPDIRIEHIETPSPYTPGGMKGMGEGGTNGAYAAVVNAVVAALPEADWSRLTTPLTPDRVWSALHPEGS